MAKLADFAIGMDSGFADHGDIRAETRRQLPRAVQINRHIAQIAVVNADDFGLQRNRALQLLFIADLGQDAHIETVGDGGELPILIIIEHRKHQQAGIGLVVTREVKGRW